MKPKLRFIKTVYASNCMEKKKQPNEPFSCIYKFWTTKSLSGASLERVGQFNTVLYECYLRAKFNA
jgi:hypothetical protein